MKPLVEYEHVEDISKELSDAFQLRDVGDGEYLFHVPFDYGDGDCFAIYIVRHGDGWRITDQGATLWRLKEDGLQFKTDKQRAFVNRLLGRCGVRLEQGELIADVDLAIESNVAAFIQAIFFLMAMAVQSSVRDEMREGLRANRGRADG